MRSVSHAAPAVWRTALTVALAVSLAGCASPPPERTWLSLPQALSAGAATASSPSPRATPLLRLVRVQVPEYLQSNRVRYRDSAATLAEWPGVRWAERIEIGLTRHLSAQLNEQLGAGSVCDDACNAVPEAGNLQVSYAALDHDRPRSQLQAQVIWTLTPSPGSASSPRQGQVSVNEAVQDNSPAGQAAAMAQVSTAVARDIAQQLRIKP